MTGPLICSMPMCQTAAGCICHLQKNYTTAGDTNCWCMPDVRRCSRPACPRAIREQQYAEQMGEFLGAVPMDSRGGYFSQRSFRSALWSAICTARGRHVPGAAFMSAT